MKHKKKIAVLIGTLSLLWACGGTTQTVSQTGAAPGAADIFAAKCAMCHDFKEDRIGPALAGVHGRWNNDTQRLKAFIRNAQEMIDKGDPYAVALYNKWNKSAMPAFAGLSEEELDALVEYLQ